MFSKKEEKENSTFSREWDIDKKFRFDTKFPNPNVRVAHFIDAKYYNKKWDWHWKGLNDGFNTDVKSETFTYDILAKKFGIKAEEEFKGKSILDVGCGNGRFCKVFADAGAKRVVGIDLSDSIKNVKENLKGYDNVEFYKMSVFSMPFDNEFDYVFSHGVLHHTPNPPKAIECLKNL